MKVALLLPGHIRTYDKTYDNLKKYILDYYDCDIFISTYETFGSKYSHIPDKVNVNLPIDKDDIINLYKPKDIIFLEDKEENSYYNKLYKGFNLGMFYSLQKCNELKIKYEQENNFKYDLVIRSRFDLLINSINYDEILLDSLNHPYIGQIWSDGITDQFAISNSDIMNIYCNLINDKDILLKDKCQKHPEILLKKHLLNNNIKLNKINVDFSLLRLNKKVSNFNTRFHTMKKNLDNFIRGWLCGNFEPALIKTENFEVGVKYFKAGEFEKTHYHKLAKEITVVISGEVEMNGIRYFEKDIIELEPNTVSDFKAIKDSITLCIRDGSFKNDKYEV